MDRDDTRIDGSVVKPIRRPPSRAHERGMTALELMVVVAIVGILSAIFLGIVMSRLDKARLARCMNELRSIQSTVHVHSGGGSELPNENTFWNVAWGGLKPGPYYYLTDAEDPNAGHGNDLDGFDEQNPGNSPRPRRDIHFVVLCQHNHKNLGWYLYLEDEGPPLIAIEGDHPGYHRFIHGGGGGGGGNGEPGGGGGNGGGGNGGGGNGGGGNGGGGNGGGGNGGGGNGGGGNGGGGNGGGQP